MNYIKPEFGKKVFTCPHCNIVSQQKFYPVAIHNFPLSDFDEFLNPIEEDDHGKLVVGRGSCFHSDFEHLVISICDYCEGYCIWLLKDKKLIFPLISGPSPNPDLPKDIIDDFNEARAIVNLSPRGSAALSRLILEKLLKYLGIEGDSLNNRIKNLVKRGLDERLQQAMDTLRVFGNEAVHPGVIDLKDDREPKI